ncbi:MAG: bacterial transcriptional activator domain-containing protein, partial [Burkholderiaceae bacterium]|nr:bacterial transcriptional activator domain-containing protein [Burkholderiaceae bacterium]
MTAASRGWSGAPPACWRWWHWSPASRGHAPRRCCGPTRTTRGRRCASRSRGSGRTTALRDALFIASGVAVDALRIDGGALLGELSFDDCEDFAAWLAHARAQRRGGETARIEQQLAAAEAAGELTEATRLAEQLLQADHDSEAHHRTLMRLHYLRGDIAQAQRVYERLARHLKARFGAQPAAETEALSRALRTAQ